MLPVAELKVGWSQPHTGLELRARPVGGVMGGVDRRRRRQESWSPFLRALGQTIAMLDHYVNYPKKTKIVTDRQPYLRSRPLNDKQDDNKTPIVVG